MDDSMEMVDESVREKLYNFYCELGWDCATAETLAENIEVPEEVLESYWLDMLSAQGDADYDSYMGK